MVVCVADHKAIPLCNTKVAV